MIVATWNKEDGLKPSQTYTWRLFLDRVDKSPNVQPFTKLLLQKESTGRFSKQCNVATITANSEFVREMLSRAETVKTIEDELRQFCGKPVRVSFSVKGKEREVAIRFTSK